MSISAFEVEKGQVVPLIKQRQYLQALELIEQMHVSDQAHRVELLDMQAVCYFRTDQYDLAVACYQQLAEDQPQLAKPWVNLGAVYNRLKRYEEAIVVLRKAIQRDKQSVDAYYNLGFAQRHAGHPDLAIPAYKEALRLNPKLEQGHLNLANAYLDINNTVMATNYYRSALVLNPELEAAKRGLQRAQKLQEQNQESQNNPFGRLVNVEQLAHQKSASAMRNLSAEERHQDREEMLKLVKGLRNAARHASEELREKMQPALLTLGRSLVDGENRPDLLAGAHERFQQELPRYQEAIRYLKRSVLELRGHEEWMNTPEMEL